MITLPDFTKMFDYENGFYLSCDTTRIGKLLAQYELYKMARDIPGTIVECGVLKGCSLVRFAAFRALFGNPSSKKIIGFDTFGDFPETNFEADKKLRLRHMEVCGPQSISREQLLEVLKYKGVDQNIELIEGDITETLPRYLNDHAELKISLLNLDVDIYEPSKVVLEHLFPRSVKGGILMLDDYSGFPGETKAVDEYFAKKNIKIHKIPFCITPSYIIKE